MLILRQATLRAYQGHPLQGLFHQIENPFMARSYGEIHPLEKLWYNCFQTSLQDRFLPRPDKLGQDEL